MKSFELNYGGHTWEKQNLVTIPSKTRGGYDEYKCKCCGIRGRSYRLGYIEIPEGSVHKMSQCRGMQKEKKIKVTHCRAVGEAFSNLTDGSVHEIIAPPAGEKNNRGEWVMGKGEPVLLLYSEFQYVKE